MSNYIEQFEQAIKSKDQKQQIAILQKALEETGIESEVMSELAGAVASYNLPFIQFLEAFCNAIPNVPHIAEVRLADYYASTNRLDDATARARQFLSKLRGTEIEKDPAAHPFFHKLMVRAYLLMTAAYTQLGARSYSQRILFKGIALNPPEPFLDRVSNEIQTLQAELKDQHAAELNAKWEEFFQHGANYDEVYNLAQKNNFPNLARRLEILEGNFRFNTEFVITDAEILMDVFQVRTNDDEDKIAFELH